MDRTLQRVSTLGQGAEADIDAPANGSRRSRGCKERPPTPAHNYTPGAYFWKHGLDDG